MEPIQVAVSGSLHRVRLGPYRTRDEAQAIADKIRASLDFAPRHHSRNPLIAPR